MEADWPARSQPYIFSGDQADHCHHDVDLPRSEKVIGTVTMSHALALSQRMSTRCPHVAPLTLVC